MRAGIQPRTAAPVKKAPLREVTVAVADQGDVLGLGVVKGKAEELADSKQGKGAGLSTEKSSEWTRTGGEAGEMDRQDSSISSVQSGTAEKLFRLLPFKFSAPFA